MSISFLVYIVSVLILSDAYYIPALDSTTYSLLLLHIQYQYYIYDPQMISYLYHNSINWAYLRSHQYKLPHLVSYPQYISLSKISGLREYRLLLVHLELLNVLWAF